MEKDSKIEKDTKYAQAVLKALSQFCAEDRPQLAEPFRDGAYMVASNGKIAVRYKIPDGVDVFPDEKQDHSHTAFIFQRNECDAEIRLTERHVDALESLYKDWCKCVSKGAEHNPDDLEELICPCCKQRLYLVGRCYGRELEDADKYDETTVDRKGFLIVMPNGRRVFLHGRVLGDIFSCYASQVLGGLFDSTFTITDTLASPKLRAEGPWCEMVCALNPYDSEHHHLLGVLEIGR